MLPRYVPAHRAGQRLRAALLAERGISVVSGLARGVDTAAHTTTLESGGRTVAVIGTGIRRCHPAENRALADRITGPSRTRPPTRPPGGSSDVDGGDFGTAASCRVPARWVGNRGRSEQDELLGRVPPLVDTAAAGAGHRVVGGRQPPRVPPVEAGPAHGQPVTGDQVHRPGRGAAAGTGVRGRPGLRRAGDDAFGGTVVGEPAPEHLERLPREREREQRRRILGHSHDLHGRSQQGKDLASVQGRLANSAARSAVLVASVALPPQGRGQEGYTDMFANNGRTLLWASCWVKSPGLRRVLGGR